MNARLSRRALLRSLALVAGGLGLARFGAKRGLALEEEDYPPRAFLPNITTGPTPGGTPGTLIGKVIHAHAQAATAWAGQTDYWNYVNQDVVNSMTDRGLRTLTNTTTVTDAWRTLLPAYQPGQPIAIKVNFNNWGDQPKIDALIYPVNALIRGLKLMGVAEADIWVYDAIRPLGNRFVNRCPYGGVRFFALDREPPGWSSTDPHAFVAFNPPAGVPVPPATRLPDVLINARYLINMPIMKGHSPAGVTLAFKNHFGSINFPGGLHDWIDYTAYPNAQYHTLVDLYRNPHIAAKTILTVGDGLFGARLGGAVPTLWSTFANHAPSSLFFAADPVALDCVMFDFLHDEFAVPNQADKYLRLASQANLGTYERGDPWGNGYALINYSKLEV